MPGSVSSAKQPFFVVGPGVDAWTDVGFVPDRRFATISICAAKLSDLEPVLRAVVLSRSPALSFVFFFAVGDIPTDLSSTQKHLRSRTRFDPPGFGGMYRKEENNRFCAAWELTDLDNIDPNYLPGDGRSILLELDSRIGSPKAVCETLCGATEHFDSNGIWRLLDRTISLSALRVFDLPYSYARGRYAVLQVIGSPETTTRISKVLLDEGLRQIDDAITVPAELARFLE